MSVGPWPTAKATQAMLDSQLLIAGSTYRKRHFLRVDTLATRMHFPSIKQALGDVSTP